MLVLSVGAKRDGRGTKEVTRAGGLVTNLSVLLKGGF